jgi:hypothetical protein
MLVSSAQSLLDHSSDQQCIVGISSSQGENFTSAQNTVIALHSGVFQRIIIYLIDWESGR